MNAESSDEVAIHWFRCDLRLADNPALAAAAANAPWFRSSCSIPRPRPWDWPAGGGGAGTRAPCAEPRGSREVGARFRGT